ncbi:MAG: hypothetical protein ABH827_02075 [bacterium]
MISKKSLFFVLINFFCFLNLNSSSLVYVHIGPDLPAYVEDVTFQARLFNETEDIYLVVSQAALDKEDKKRMLAHMRDDLYVKIVPVESLTRSQEHEAFTKKTTLNSRCRAGFWKFTSERFLVLDDFICQYNLQDVVHCENDVLLYSNLQELLPGLRENYTEVAALFEHDDRCISSFVYVRDSNAMKKIAQYFAAHAQEGKNDMKMLAGFRAENSESVGLLPIISQLYIEREGLRNSRGDTASNSGVYSKNIDLFKSVFDAAALGQYLGGQDPRNGPCNPGFASGKCLFNAGLLTYRWKKDASGRSVPFMAYGGQEYRINNLHIHSKNLKKFLSMPTSNMPVSNMHEAKKSSGVYSGRAFITGEQFKHLADYVVQDAFCSFDINTIEPKSIIFVKVEVLKYFFQVIFPYIRVPVILITHGSDASCPGRFKKYLGDPRILVWFCQNCDIVHDKIFAIPMGVAHAGLEYADISVFNTVLNMLDQAPVKTKIMKAYFNPGLAGKEVCDYFKKKKYVFHATKQSGQESLCESLQECLLEMARCAFTLCPASNGADCPEVWRALLVGSIPVVLSSPADVLFKDLPVVIVKSWKHLTPDLLQEKYKEILKKKYSRDMLFFDYWCKEVKNFV